MRLKHMWHCVWSLQRSLCWSVLWLAHVQARMLLRSKRADHTHDAHQGCSSNLLHDCLWPDVSLVMHCNFLLKSLLEHLLCSSNKHLQIATFMCLGSAVLHASACLEVADLHCTYLMPIRRVCISRHFCYYFVTVIVIAISFFSSVLPVFILTQAVPVQLTGTLPAFMSTITSLVEMELESNKVHPAAMPNAVSVHMK